MCKVCLETEVRMVAVESCRGESKDKVGRVDRL